MVFWVGGQGAWISSCDTGRKGLSSRAEPLFFFAGAPAPPAASKAPPSPQPQFQSPSGSVDGGRPAGPSASPWLVGEAFPFPSPEQACAEWSWLPVDARTLPLPLSLGQPPPSPLLSHSLFACWLGRGQPPLSPCSPTRGTWPSPVPPGEPEGPFTFGVSLLPPPPSDLLPPLLHLLATSLPLSCPCWPWAPQLGMEGSAEGAGGPSGETFSGLGDLPPLLFPNSQLPHPHSFKFCAAGCQPGSPSGTPPR